MEEQQKVTMTPIGMVASVLAIGILVFYVGIIASIMFFDIQAERLATVKDMATDLRTILVMVFSFFFGSSMGSWRKNDKPG